MEQTIRMPAWDCGAREEVPGWHRAVECFPRAVEIARTVVPPPLEQVELDEVLSSGRSAADRC